MRRRAHRGGGALGLVVEAFRGVSDGTRTRGRRDHNPELYQLSYAHQDGLSIAPGGAAVGLSRRPA